MSKIKEDIDDLHQDPLVNSSEGDYLHIIKNDDGFDNPVTYKLVSMQEDDNSTNMQDSPVHDTTYYVISNPVEVFGSPATVPKRPMKTITLNNKNKASTKKRDDKRRATHNEVERRRRDKINNWIMKLADLVPNARMPDSASKGGILAKACDHITELTERQKRLEKLELENENLVREVLRLNQELAELRKNSTNNSNQLTDKNSMYMRHKGQKS